MKIGKWEITIKDFIWFTVCLIGVICGFIGLFVCDDVNAAAVLSGASTAISIALSLVAIFYTMIESANSSKISQEVIDKLGQLDLELQTISSETQKLDELKAVLDRVIPDVDSVLKSIAQESGKDDLSIFTEQTRQNIIRLRAYMEEDIDE